MTCAHGRKTTVRNRYNQIPHLTQGTIWESDKHTRKHNIRESQEVSPFPAGDYKAARLRQGSLTDKHETQITKKDPQKKQRLGTVKKKITGKLKQV